jgi:hypothetical protein
MIISTILFAIAKSSFHSEGLLITAGSTSALAGACCDTASVLGHDLVGAGATCAIVGLFDGAV